MVAAISAATVRRSLATHLSARGVGVWSETTPYEPDDRAIVLRDLPTAPDAAVAIEVYDTEDGLVLPDVPVRVQLMFRGRGDDADEFADAAFAVLHGQYHYDMGEMRVQRSRRLYTAPLGADENGRERRSDNYELLFMRA